MINKIWYLGNLIVGRRKEGRKSIIGFEDGKELGSSQIYNKKIEIECNECFERKEVKFYGALWKRHYLCQSCLKMGAKNPFYGKSHTEGFKEKLSNDRKGTWCVGEDNAMHGVNIWDTYSKKEKEEKRKKISDGQTGSKNHFYGKHHSEEMKRRMSEFWKQKFIEDPSHMRRIQKMALEKQKKGFKSSIERKTQVELERRGFTFRYSKVLHRKYQFDFIICDEILLEVHGDYWHANPKYYGDGKKEINATQKKKIELDERKKVYANSYGYEIFYIWENEVNDGNFSVLDRIEKEIKRRSKWKNTN